MKHIPNELLPKLILGLILITAVLAGVVYFASNHSQRSVGLGLGTAPSTAATSTTATSTSVLMGSTSQQQPSTSSTLVPPPTSSTHPYGYVALALNETAQFPDLTLEPLELIQDSRCPVDVQCIQAGTVRVKIRIASGLGTSTPDIELNKSVTTEAETITLTSVLPARTSRTNPAPSEYRFTFNVQKNRVPVGPAVPVGQPCYVGGCSGQLCTDDPHAVSDCMYSPKYACYASARCERQSTGQCGWTPTPQLQACLANS